MSEAAFTPGPYVVEGSIYKSFCASITAHGINVGLAKQYKDALLFAAAPDLYEALVEFLKVDEILRSGERVGGPAIDRLSEIACAALSKARGQSPINAPPPSFKELREVHDRSAARRTQKVSQSPRNGGEG